MKKFRQLMIAVLAFSLLPGAFAAHAETGAWSEEYDEEYDAEDFDADFLDLSDDFDEDTDYDLFDEMDEETDEVQVPASQNMENQTFPDWFPEDPAQFQFYHDPDAPRVIDNADIFTDAEEEEMYRLISEYVPETGKDIVIYTDNTTYGFDKDILTVDFYDFNGYGIGPEHEGICLFICMDPANRGWWAAATGPESQAYYTQGNANLLDSALYDYMANGAYGAGVEDWIYNVHTLFTKGMVFPPDWYQGEEWRWTQEEAIGNPRIVDEPGVLSEAQWAELCGMAEEISSTYGIDVVVDIAKDSYGMDYGEYADIFYDYLGYGLGENRDGLLLVLFENTGFINISAYGNGYRNLSDVNFDRLYDQTRQIAGERDMYGAAKKWLSLVKKMEKSGRVPRTFLSWLITGVFGSLLGAVFGFFSLGKAKAKMRTIRAAEYADAYVDGTPVVRAVNDIYITTHTSRRRIEKQSSGTRSSSSSSSSGRSSYRSSYSGSSGRSHTGSGRSF